MTTPYEAIVAYLARYGKSYLPALEIDILPKAFEFPEGTICQAPGVSYNEKSLGVRKDALFQAFVEARKIFFAHYQDEEPAWDISRASQVLTLFDPEHITAINYRKRFLAHGDSLMAPGNNWRTMVIETELVMLKGFLTSRLNRHNKSPTLWSHRRWLMENFSNEEDLEPWADRMLLFGDSLMYEYHQEMTILLRAAELHPNNYYAFDYARWYFTRAGNPYLPSKMHPMRPTEPCCVNSWIETRMVDWCKKHPSDISGWAFWSQFLRSECSPNSHRHRIVDRIEELVELAFFHHWKHPAFWVTIRALLAAPEQLPPRMSARDWSG